MTWLRTLTTGDGPSQRIDESVAQRLRRVVELHFDPVEGSAFWLDRARRLGIDPRREVRELADLAALGQTTADDLRSRPLLDFVPRRLHRRLDLLTVCQTGGTTAGGVGFGTWTAYRDDEMAEAFVLPFVAAARRVGFPAHEQWLFVGPSGPHVIGKAARHLAASLGSAEPFGVDFDPRWARRLTEGSFARRRYLGHVVEQAMAIVATQDVGVLFTTPPVLDAMADAMTHAQRLRVRGVHHGGMAIAAERMLRFQTDLFPEAVHLSGYGNTLFGCALELSSAPGREIRYFPWGNRLIFETQDAAGEASAEGEPGLVHVTRLDETMFIVRMPERDVATLVPPPDDAPPEFRLPGVLAPGPRPTEAARVSGGLY